MDARRPIGHRPDPSLPAHPTFPPTTPTAAPSVLSTASIRRGPLIASLPAPSFLSERITDSTLYHPWPSPTGSSITRNDHRRRIVVSRAPRSSSPSAVSAGAIAHRDLGACPDGLADQCAPSLRSTPNRAVYAHFSTGADCRHPPLPVLGTPGIHPYLVGSVKGQSSWTLPGRRNLVDGAASDSVIRFGHSQCGQGGIVRRPDKKRNRTPRISGVGVVRRSPPSPRRRRRGPTRRTNSTPLAATRCMALYAWFPYLWRHSTRVRNSTPRPSPPRRPSPRSALTRCPPPIAGVPTASLFLPVGRTTTVQAI